MSEWLRNIFGIVLIASVLLTTGVSARPQDNAMPAIRIDLSPHGLPKDFFKENDYKSCPVQLNGYRSIMWLDSELIAIVFNTSPDCRNKKAGKVAGNARAMVFDLAGELKATRDFPYEVDGEGILVFGDDAKVGPSGTLLFETQTPLQSGGEALLLDQSLKDVAHYELGYGKDYIEDTTFVEHALVFSEPTEEGSNVSVYSIKDGKPPVVVEQLQEQSRPKIMHKAFGEHSFAAEYCHQAFNTRSLPQGGTVSEALGPLQCKLKVETKGASTWESQLKDGESVQIVGVLRDGSVVGEINLSGNKAGSLGVWKKDREVEILPWIPNQYRGLVKNASSSFSRYLVYGTNDSSVCEDFGKLCGNSGRLWIFDRRSQIPLVDRAFPKNGRAAISPDGLRYASFESGELRIYALPRS